MIGVIPLVDLQRESYWMLPGYFQGLEEAGAVPVMLPLSSDPDCLAQIADSFDGFLLTGGQDVEPDVYHAEKLPLCGECSPERDSMECALLPLVLEKDKPVLGICRGIQIINAALGGTLYQDLPVQHPSEVVHHMDPPYDRASHSVDLIADAPLASILGCSRIGVNSCHHQGIRELAPSLLPAAIAEDGLVEGAYMPGKRFVLAVQWHPEFSFRKDPCSRAILSAFVRACR